MCNSVEVTFSLEYRPHCQRRSGSWRPRVNLFHFYYCQLGRVCSHPDCVKTFLLLPSYCPALVAPPCSSPVLPTISEVLLERPVCLLSAVALSSCATEKWNSSGNKAGLITSWDCFTRSREKTSLRRQGGQVKLTGLGLLKSCSIWSTVTLQFSKMQCNESIKRHCNRFSTRGSLGWYWKVTGSDLLRFFSSAKSKWI